MLLTDTEKESQYLVPAGEVGMERQHAAASRAEGMPAVLYHVGCVKCIMEGVIFHVHRSVPRLQWHGVRQAGRRGSLGQSDLAASFSSPTLHGWGTPECGQTVDGYESSWKLGETTQLHWNRCLVASLTPTNLSCLRRRDCSSLLPCGLPCTTRACTKSWAGQPKSHDAVTLSLS